MGIFSNLFGKKLLCGSCGRVQLQGAWEKEMDRQVRAQGSQGFFNLSAQAQCLACGSTDLHDPSEDSCEPEVASDVQNWCRELRQWSDRYYAGEHSPAEGKMKEIGETINAQGGEQKMAEIYWAIKHPPTQRNVNGCWRGIGTWTFSKYD